MRKKLLIHNIEALSNLEITLTAAVTTVLAIRFYLHITNYPQVGGGNLHIAHMLWGGLLMLIAIAILLSYLNKPIYKIAAVIGGIGFGTFIDELGKFITKDNNYFFEPTVAIIYVIFIILYLLFYALTRSKKLSEEEYFNNAFELTRIALLGKSNLSSKTRAIAMLQHCNQNDPTVQTLIKVLETITPKDAPLNLFTKIANEIHSIYESLLHKKFITRGILVFFICYMLYNLYNAVDIISLYWRLDDFTLSFEDLGEFASLIASAIVMIGGIIRMQWSHRAGYKLFRIAVLISIFLTEFFDFYKNQFAAMVILLLNLFVLFILQYIISQEESSPS